MEELFKSLSESVSEECFEDILRIVEELLNEDTATYARDKANNLKDKAEGVMYKEYMNGGKHGKLMGKAWDNAQTKIEKLQKLANKAEKLKQDDPQVEEEGRKINGTQAPSRQSHVTSFHDYQLKKNIATKALKGHNTTGAVDSSKVDKKAEHLNKYTEQGWDNSDGYETLQYLKRNKGSNNSGTPITTNPKALYRIGNNILKRRTK